MMGNSWGGTVLYMAPEQSDGARQNEIGPASDIYALGVVSYEMLAGRVPFEGANPHVVMDAHRRLPPPDPRQFNPQLPANVVPVLMTVLDKQPANRYPTATAFVEALAQASQGQPIGITTGSLRRGISSSAPSGITTSSLKRGGGSSSARSVPRRPPVKILKKRQQPSALVGTLATVAFLLLLTIVMLAWSSMNNPALIQEAISATQTAEAIVLSAASPSPEGEEPTEIASLVTDTPLPTTSTPEAATLTPEAATLTPEAAALTPESPTLTPIPPTPIPPTQQPAQTQPVTMNMVSVGRFIKRMGCQRIWGNL